MDFTKMAIFIRYEEQTETNQCDTLGQDSDRDCLSLHPVSWMLESNTSWQMLKSNNKVLVQSKYHILTL